MNRSWQRLIGVAGVVATACVMVLLFVYLTADDPIAAAKAQPGAAGASFLGLDRADGPFGGQATVRLRPPGKGSQPLEIRLSRPFWSWRWRSVPAGP
jgi:hypothetical protein